MCMSASQARVWRSLGKGRIPEKKRMGQGRNVCGLKGGWLKKASSPVIHRPAKPCGKTGCHPRNIFCRVQVAETAKTGKGSSFLGGSAKRERDKRRKGDGHGKNKIFNPDG